MFQEVAGMESVGELLNVGREIRNGAAAVEIRSD